MLKELIADLHRMILIEGKLLLNQATEEDIEKAIIANVAMYRQLARETLELRIQLRRLKDDAKREVSSQLEIPGSANKEGG